MIAHLESMSRNMLDPGAEDSLFVTVTVGRGLPIIGILRLRRSFRVNTFVVNRRLGSLILGATRNRKL